MRVVAIALVVVAGCGVDDDLADIREFMARVQTDQEAQVHSSTQSTANERFVYRHGGRRSPFSPSAGWRGREGGSPVASAIAGEAAPRPFLQRYPLGRIAMVGTMNRGFSRYALVRVDGGEVHRVGVGDYLGEERGRIRKIEPRALHLVASAPDGEGGRVQRPYTISLDFGSAESREDLQP